MKITLIAGKGLNFGEKLAQAKVESERFERICDGIWIARQDALRNRYTLEVYEQTNNLLQNPEGYIADMNHHNHLAAKSNSSDWLFLYELPFVEQVKAWVNK